MSQCRSINCGSEIKHINITTFPMMPLMGHLRHDSLHGRYSDSWNHWSITVTRVKTKQHTAAAAASRSSNKQTVKAFHEKSDCVMGPLTESQSILKSQRVVGLVSLEDAFVVTRLWSWTCKLAIQAWNMSTCSGKKPNAAQLYDIYIYLHIYI